MDTPKKTQIGTPLSKSKFEDSPVFNYINSLSPIEPVKSIHIAQTFNSLSFSSPPSVFTSPHLSSHKESRFFRSHNSSDPSKPEFSSEDGNKISSEVASVEKFEPRASMGDNSIEPPSDNCEMKLPQILNYDCGSPNCHDTPGTNGTSLVPFVQEDKGSSEVGLNLQKMCDVNAKNETPDWESLISDATELLIFSSSNDSEAFRGLMQKTSDPETGDIRNDGTDDKVHDESEACVPLSYEPASSIHRGMRRRCLDFEMLGAQRKQLGGGSNSSSSIDNPTTSNSKSCHDSSSRRILSGIGLHLNALAMTSKNRSNKNIKHESPHFGKIHISLPSSNVLLHSLESTGQESLSSDPAKAETVSAEDDGQHAEDVSKGSVYLDGEELNPSSPKKKRRKFEQAGEGEACKRCNCKKSKCLKLYCECFAAGVYCIEPCSCIDCFNKPIHEDTVLATRKQIESRNPLAFAPKVIKSSEAISETGDDSSKTPASARHKRGCNCKKSNCLKKYCECYQGGVGCSINCRCEGCKNAFGRKDGTFLIGTEVEPEEENEASEKHEMAKTLQNSEIPNEEQNLNSAIPSTPLPRYRALVQIPFLSNTKPQPQSFLGAGSSSSVFHNNQKNGKPSIVLTQSKSAKRFESITGEEMEMPEILIHSPVSTIKTASPNSKRVFSPPHFDSSSGSTPERRSGRKLILQSIPSFPSLTPQH